MGKREFLEKYLAERLPTQVWSRCMGYYRNTASFNIGKQSEFRERVFFTIKGNYNSN